jgi:hypothetical protein
VAPIAAGPEGQRSHTCLQKKIPLFWKTSKLLTNNFTFLGREFRITMRLTNGDPSGILDWRRRIVDAHFFVDGISALSGSERLGQSVFDTQKSARIKSQTRKAIHRAITLMAEAAKTMTTFREGVAVATAAAAASTASFIFGFLQA